MKNRLVLLAEYVTSPAVELTPHDASSLRRAVTTMSVVPSSDVPGTYDLTPGSEVGVVALDSCCLVIRPKVPIDRVLFLVSYALDSASWREQTALYNTAEDIVEGMAAVFVHELRRALRRGLLQGYRSTEDALTTVRGRIRFDEQLRRRFGATLPLEVRFDEYTEDTELNRVLRAALWRLSRLPIRSRRVRSPQARLSPSSAPHTLGAEEGKTARSGGGSDPAPVAASGAADGKYDRTRGD